MHFTRRIYVLQSKWLSDNRFGGESFMICLFKKKVCNEEDRGNARKR